MVHTTSTPNAASSCPTQHSVAQGCESEVKNGIGGETAHPATHPRSLVYWKVTNWLRAFCDFLLASDSQKMYETMHSGASDHKDLKRVHENFLGQPCADSDPKFK